MGGTSTGMTPHQLGQQLCAIPQLCGTNANELLLSQARTQHTYTTWTLTQRVGFCEGELEVHPATCPLLPSSPQCVSLLPAAGVALAVVPPGAHQVPVLALHSCMGHTRHSFTQPHMHRPHVRLASEITRPWPHAPAAPPWPSHDLRMASPVATLLSVACYMHPAHGRHDPRRQAVQLSSCRAVVKMMRSGRRAGQPRRLPGYIPAAA